MFKLLNSSIAGVSVILFITSDKFLNRYITTRLWTDPLFILLSFTTNIMFLLYLERKKDKYLFGAAVLAGLSYLDRPNGLFLILTMLFTLLGYEIWLVLGQRFERVHLLKMTIRKYSIFIGIIILTTVPSWLPRVSYTGNPIYHDYLPNYMWVDTYEEGHIQGPPRYSMHDYFANHNLMDVINRVQFGMEKVFYADTIVRQRWPYSFLVVLGLVIGCLSIKPQYLLLTIFMFLQMFPIVWTYLPNQTLRIPYVSLLPFAAIYLAVFLSSSIKFLSGQIMIRGQQVARLYSSFAPRSSSQSLGDR